jgi:hypothetical protein
LASRARRDLVAGLGLVRPSRKGAIAASGYASLTPDTVPATVVTGAPTGPACHDRIATPAPAFALRVAHGRLFADYVLDTDSLRSRCAGPTAGDDLNPAVAASGSIPLTALRHRVVTIPLHRVGRLTDDGYRVTASSTLSLVMERTSVTESTF